MKQFLIKIKKFSREHFYIFILLLLSLFFFHNIISSVKILDNIHYINDVTFYSYNMKKALQEHSLPLWTPYYYSGRPLFAQPEYYFIDFNLLLILLTGNIYLAMNSSVIIHFFLSGLGMYLLVDYLSENKMAAFISALIYMFNGFVHTFIVPGNIMILEGYSLIPFIFLFTIKALKGKDFVFNSIIAGIFVAFQIFVGGVIFLPYLFVLVAVYSIFYLIDGKFSNKILKLLVVGLIIGLVGFCISAVKLLPGLEFLQLSNRQSGLNYQEYLGEPIKMANFAFAFMSNSLSTGSSISSAIGIIGFILFIFGLYKFKNKIVLFSLVAILLSFFMSSESFLSKLLFNLPLFNQTRHIERSIFLFAFAASILAGFGFMNLDLFIEKYKKINKKIFFMVIVLIILLELCLLQKFPQSTMAVQPGQIPILDYMSKDTSTFRTANFALKTDIGATGYNYYSQLGISEIKGGSGIWFSDYLSYLYVAQNSPAKMLGVLNNKYIILDKKMDIDGLKLIDKFKDCRECALWEAWGPYLYENTKFAPRYYIVPNSVLVVGKNTDAINIIYSLMLQNSNASNNLFIAGSSLKNSDAASINDFDSSFLNKFSMIFLTQGSVDQNSMEKLREYKQQGGILLPDIVNGQNTATSSDINNFFNKTRGNYKEIKIDEYKNNRVVLDLNGEKGWLVASERFAYFPGWKATINGKDIEMVKANNVVTAIYLDGENGKLNFEYAPSPYKIGKLISLLSFILLIIYFGYFAYSRKSRKGDENQA